VHSFQATGTALTETRTQDTFQSLDLPIFSSRSQGISILTYVGEILSEFSGNQEPVRIFYTEINGNFTFDLRIFTLQAVFIKRIMFIIKGWVNSKNFKVKQDIRPECGFPNVRHSQTNGLKGLILPHNYRTSSVVKQYKNI
jgi:hypothetical protein